jgi:hypothetical protein
LDIRKRDGGRIVFPGPQTPQTGMVLIDQCPYTCIAGHVRRKKLLCLAPVFFNAGDHWQVIACRFDHTEKLSNKFHFTRRVLTLLWL